MNRAWVFSKNVNNNAICICIPPALNIMIEIDLGMQKLMAYFIPNHVSKHIMSPSYRAGYSAESEWSIRIACF